MTAPAVSQLALEEHRWLQRFHQGDRALMESVYRDHFDTVDDAVARVLSSAAAHRADVIDAAVVLLAHDDTFIVTSDPEDIEPLAAASGRHVEIIRG